MTRKWIKARQAADRRTELEMLERANRIGEYLQERKQWKCEITASEVIAGRAYERAAIAAAEREAARRRG